MPRIDKPCISQNGDHHDSADDLDSAPEKPTPGRVRHQIGDPALAYHLCGHLEDTAEQQEHPERLEQQRSIYAKQGQERQRGHNGAKQAHRTECHQTETLSGAYAVQDRVGRHLKDATDQHCRLNPRNMLNGPTKFDDQACKQYASHGSRHGGDQSLFYKQQLLATLPLSGTRVRIGMAGFFASPVQSAGCPQYKTIIRRPGQAATKQ